MKISIVIPVYNEKGRLESVLSELKDFYEIIVIDDYSEISVESYVNKDKYSNLIIVRNAENLGYLSSIKKAISLTSGEIVVTMDGDGEHKPYDIPNIIQSIVNNECDIVFGKRPNIARPSERLLLKMAKFFTGETVQDSGTGFRAIKSSFAKELEFKGMCTCGLLLMEAHKKQMRICEVDVDLAIVNKPRRIAWEHFKQFFYVIWYNMRQIL